VIARFDVLLADELLKLTVEGRETALVGAVERLTAVERPVAVLERAHDERF
jgi:hypothetical protein